jgi:hypothetical protein
MRDGRRPAPRLSGDGGSVVVEAAIVLPLLLVLAGGIIDFGLGLRAQTVLQTAVRNAARGGAAAVSDPTADILILSTLQAGVSGFSSLDIDKVIVYESPTSGLAPPACTGLEPNNLTATGITNVCNIYSAQQMNVAANTPGSFVRANTSGACTSGWDRFWCPRTMRTASLTGTVDGLGVWVRANYTPYTDVFSTGDIVLTDYIVMNLEPPPG